MHFSAIAVLLTYVTFGFLQFASATPILSTKDMMVKRDNADISGILTTLKTDLAGPLAGITALTLSGNVTEQNITPLLNSVTASLNTAATSLSGLSPSDLRKRQTDDELANLVAGIINDIAKALQGLEANLATIPLLAGLLSGIDVALNQVLLGLGILLKGVLNLVAQLLVNVAALLRNLAFGLSLGTLGL